MLARENAIRQPQRTAVTAAALMVGLALVVLVTVFAAGLRASVDKTIDDQVSAALIVQNQDGFTPIPHNVVDDGGRRRRASRRCRRCASRPALVEGRRRQHRRHRHRPDDGQLRAQAQVGSGRREDARTR